MIELRQYQREALEAFRRDWRNGVKRVLVSMPTGTGKTWLYVFAIWGARKNGLRSLVLENTDELIEQSVEKLKRVGVEPGVIKAGKNEWMRDVVVASVQTLSKTNRLYNLPPNHFGLVITDEAHYANAPSYQRVLWYFANSWHLGVTATPFRGDKKSLAGAGWDAVSYVYTMQQAIKDDWLAPMVFRRVDTGVELKGLIRAPASCTATRDFNAKALAKIIDTPERNKLIVDAALQHLLVRNGPLNVRMRRSIGFCADVSHSVNLANAFRQRGIEAFAVYGSMKEKARRLVLRAHREGRFPILTNCNILTHGYDDPGLEAVIMARPTESKVLYLQEIGRGSRKSPETGKTDCIVLDVVDVAKKHALTIGPELLELEEALDERNKGETKILTPSAPAGEIPGLIHPEVDLSVAPVSDEPVPELVRKPDHT